MRLGSSMLPAVAALRGQGLEGNAFRVERAGVRWTLTTRITPGDLTSLELVSTVVNDTCGGLALPAWGAGSGLYFHVVTPDGQKVFDTAWDAPGAVTVLHHGGRRVTRVPLGLRPLRQVVELDTPPWRSLRGISDPLLDHLDHLWLVASQHTLRGPSLVAQPMLLPLGPWRRGEDHGTSLDSGLFESLDRLRWTELIYRPGRLLLGFGRDLALADAKRIVASQGLSVCSERLYGATGFLEVAVPAGRESARAAELEETGLVRVATREPLVCGLSS